MNSAGRRDAGRGKRPWGSGKGEEGLLLSWPSWLSWTSKLRVCSEEAGLSLPQRDRCPFDGEKKGCCTERVEEGGRGRQSLLPVATSPPCGHPGNGRDHTVSHLPSPVHCDTRPTTGILICQGNGQMSWGQGLVTS